MHTVHIFGVPIHDITEQEALLQVTQYLQSDTPHIIVTPNPEILLHAKEHPQYTQTLQKADLSVPDGFGLQLCSSIQNRIPGADFAQNILDLADRQRLSVGCVIRSDGRSTSAQIHNSITRMAPNVRLSIVEVTLKDIHNQSIIDTLNEHKPDIIFVGLGFPHQEEWLVRNLQHIDSAPVGIGIGGTFDFWTKSAKRAPYIFRRIGLEWLWRLVTQPRRIYRIFRATILFPLAVLLSQKK